MIFSQRKSSLSSDSISPQVNNNSNNSKQYIIAHNPASRIPKNEPSYTRSQAVDHQNHTSLAALTDPYQRLELLTDQRIHLRLRELYPQSFNHMISDHGF